MRWQETKHSYISYRVADGGDVNRTALESGNSPAMIFSNYRELVTPEQAKQWFAILPKQDKPKRQKNVITLPPVKAAQLVQVTA